ncbi:hypothetical protein L0O81_16845, partial [Oliverpabstia sp. DFI.9.49]|nr:hypothetical protein [Oliverpabstia sp. DFI.9.49]
DILFLPTKGPPHNFLVTFFNITDLAKFSKEILQTFVPHYFNTSSELPVHKWPGFGSTREQSTM